MSPDHPTGTPIAPTKPRAARLGDFRERPGEAFEAVRAMTLALIEPLEIEDLCLQSMPDASPVKWHLAHTAWFFETFVLSPALPDYRPFHPRFGYLFNSYYETVGRMHPRPKRGLLSRPTVAQVLRYRDHVDEHLTRWLATGHPSPDQLKVVELGLHHEQQHQELILTDLKHGLAQNPLRPTYMERPAQEPSCARSPAWLDHEGGIHPVGFAGDTFHFDNEGPRHDVLLQPFSVADQLVTCGEYLEFIQDGGYERPELWLSAGWNAVQTGKWRAPLYWEQHDGAWSVFTLHGMQPVDPCEPVVHVSLFEADAFARWADARLPTEAEWEHALGHRKRAGTFLESRSHHPRPNMTSCPHAFGDAWVWTRSAYGPYPGYRPPSGALGEYNGKFMCSQLVLRGGSCATPEAHIRATYRNFFHPPDRWQFSGIRLARDR